MSEIKIIYNGCLFNIQHQSHEKLEEILKRFTIKANVENKELIYLYNGKIIEDKNIIISQFTSERNITILVYDNNIPKNSNNSLNSNYVVCPICKESAILDEKDYKLLIYGCQNEHSIKNILINEFNQLQENDLSKIKCQNCNDNNKKNTYNNEFYRCGTCKINLCPICKSKHDTNHKIINYNDKDFKCSIHNERYNSFCSKCKENLCLACKNNHNGHELIFYDKLIIEDNKIIEKMDEMKKEIDTFNNSIKEKIRKLNKIIENMEEYYKIIDEIIKKYINNKNRNYQILINVNNIINNNNIIKKIKSINNNNNKYDDIIDIYNKIYNIDDNKNIDDKNKNIIKIEEGKGYQLILDNKKRGEQKSKNQKEFDVKMEIILSSEIENLVKSFSLKKDDFWKKVISKFDINKIDKLIGSIFKEGKMVDSTFKQLNLILGEIKEKFKNVEHLNILLVGPSGVGKTTLINAILELKNQIKTGFGMPVTYGIQFYTSEKVLF